MDKMYKNVYVAAATFLQDAQNRVAAFALCQLFPDLPVQLVVTEPYSSLIFQWKGGDGLDTNFYLEMQNNSKIYLVHKCFFGIFQYFAGSTSIHWFNSFVLMFYQYNLRSKKGN